MFTYDENISTRLSKYKHADQGRYQHPNITGIVYLRGSSIFKNDKANKISKRINLNHFAGNILHIYILFIDSRSIKRQTI
jgi:hypothetical protein